MLRLFVKVYQQLHSLDCLRICQSLAFLDEPEDVANILEKFLCLESKEDALLAFQFAFDLVENELHDFLLNVKDHLLASKSLSSESVQPRSTDFTVLEDVLMTCRSSDAMTNMYEPILKNVVIADLGDNNFF
ncbi:hypothetical protein V6N11_036183 [Hibiscus sabdariffa]|uniref:26S proteasome non-ATPase regulatory subunit 1/RPN2 N-terminal domain-containing protein n=1 Tax=Hibiscus sabdariffa TaxID=183260 RepID=A0ABR2RA39_9ROSI